ncbi:hypothetical protein QU770_20440, partial [Escherichia coli]|nr:hypothetical protein [Escherichia coli]
MSQITSPATYSISRPQDVIDIVNKNSAINTSIGVIFIALGGILIDAYQALMNPLMILVKIIKLRWIHILSYD